MKKEIQDIPTEREKFYHNVKKKNNIYLNTQGHDRTNKSRNC